MTSTVNSLSTSKEVSMKIPNGLLYLIAEMIEEYFHEHPEVKAAIAAGEKVGESK